MPSSRARVSTVSRVMPSRMELESGGVTSRPFLTMKMFSPEPFAHVALRIEEHGFVVAGELRLGLASTELVYWPMVLALARLTLM